MAEFFDIREIDRDALYDQLADLTEGPEYEELSWYRDIFYMLDEGFLAIDSNGGLYVLEECPTCLE